ncbi:hypothetical protein [Endozoicomonas sp. ALB091]|uniref:hypothetical protein n=1 Tax=Endozoicomonas sp. ALB091 TaxID=3403073 RepID=UPI003BB4CB5B
MLQPAGFSSFDLRTSTVVASSTACFFFFSLMHHPLKHIDMWMLMFASGFSAGNQGLRVLGDSVNSFTPPILLTKILH